MHIRHKMETDTSTSLISKNNIIHCVDIEH